MPPQALFRLLLLEDSADDADLLAIELAGAGMGVELRRVATRDAYAAALAGFAPDIVVSDYDLPGFSGGEALLMARAHDPALPFVVLVMTPFIEQIDTNIESAARMCGAGTRQVFTRVLVPLLIPGILAAAVLVLVRTVAMFELTFLVAGPDSQTLIVALYSAAFTPGIRAAQAIDAMAVLYTLLSSILLVIALSFVNPTQIVAQVKEVTPE